MTMIELAVEYRQSAVLLKERIAILKAQLAHDSALCEMDKFRLRGRIDALTKMEREVTEIAVLMERYYERGYRRNVRYSV